MDMDPEPKPFTAGQQGQPVYGMPPGSRSRRSRLLLVGVPVVAVFTAFAAVVWMAHDRGAGGSPVGEPPLIRASTAPIKLSPDQADGSDVAEEGEVRELLADLPFEQQLERLLPLPEEPRPAPEQLLLPTPSEIGEAEPSPQPAPAPDRTAAAPSQASGQAETSPQLAPAPDQMVAVQPRPTGQAGRVTEPPAEAATAASPQRAESPEPASPSREPPGPMIEPAPPRPPVAAQSAEAASSRPATPQDSEQSAEAALDALIAEVTQRAPQQPDRRPQATGSRPEAVAPPARREPPASSSSRPREPQMAATTPTRPLDGTSTGQAAREPVITVAPGQGRVSSDPGYRVQLAAVREPADARRAWDLFMLDLGPILSRYQPYFERADTDNGVFYRVQIGSFASAESAESVCDELKRRNASCFVVRR